MIAHPDIAAKVALGAYHERIEQAHINHMINRAVQARTAAAVDATGNDDLTRSTRLTRSIKRLLGHARQPNIVGGNHPGTLNPPPMTATAS
jgi:hypothetical protein